MSNRSSNSEPTDSRQIDPKQIDPKNERIANPRIGIIVPTLLEQKCLSRHGEKVDYQVISGMGKVNAALAAARAILYEECDVVLLVGFCGGGGEFEIGDVVHPAMLVEADFDAGTLEPPRSEKIERAHVMPGYNATFLTIDKFLKCIDGLSMWSLRSIVEMEAWGALQACRRFGAQFESIRVVSDIVGANTEGDFLEACKKLGPVLAGAVDQAVKSIREWHNGEEKN